MLGYVKPLKGQLKVLEWQRYSGVYCGLCHALRKKYGLLARGLVHYDFAFFALLLGSPEFSHRRCIASPFRKKCVACGSHQLEYAADAAVLLTYWKLTDSIRDNFWIKGLFFRVIRFWLRGKYRKAAKVLPETDVSSRENLIRLWRMEDERNNGMDAAADTFAKMLSALAEADGGSRVLRSLLYHTGRWIYIIDACDDLKRDARAGRYNPVAERFGLSDGELTGEVKNLLENTLAFSRQAALSASALLGRNTEIVENILLLGMEKMEKEVFSSKKVRLKGIKVYE